MMYQGNAVDALKKFPARERWEFLALHLPGSFLEHQKDELLDSPASKCLFNEDVSAKLITEYKENTSLATQSALQKVVSLPSKSPVASRAKTQASSTPPSGYSAEGQNKDGSKCKGS